MDQGKLYIVATPIGNLGDISLRALEILKGVDFILCEDTRVTAKLLEHYQISRPLISYHHHSDVKKIHEIKNLLSAGKNLALVTDAGTPGISDPGGLLIQSVILSEARRACPERQSNGAESKNPLNLETEGIPPLAALGRNDNRVVPIPGPSALIAALSISGFPADKFVFMGFPPHKNKRQKFFKEVAEQKYTVVFYESGHRIKKCLGELAAVLPPKAQMLVARELTKMFETIYRGTIFQILEQKIDERGEFVVIISV